MELQIALEHRARVEEFQRKHRTGLLTLVFTDTVGSTKLKHVLGDSAAVALIQQHHATVREILGQFKEAEEISTAGDSFFLVFVKPSDAGRFALKLQARLREEAAHSGTILLDRVGIHIGEVIIEERETGPKTKDLYGIQVDICARLVSLAEGGQILLTRSAFDNARQVLKGQDLPGVGPLLWMNHGPYLLKGIEESVEICEVGEAGVAPLHPPQNSDKAHRHISADTEPVLGWRPAVGQSVPNTKWVLEKKLGEGGFGEVWLGRHETLKEQRVFKFCFHADRVRSLKREVTLFRLLKERVGQHPNIVGVQEVFFDEPPFYIVMDYAEGKDLRGWCDELGGVEKIPFPARLEIVAQVAAALQAAHDAGVIHRDVKPTNILVRNDAAMGRVQVKLTDFGIGQVISQEALAGMTRMGFTQTLVGSGSSTQTGTLMYMAPELIAGRPASKQSDVYSLAVVLYQLAIGDLSQPVSPDWARKIRDPILREDLEKCFAGNPEERLGSASELADNLRSLEKRQRDLSAQQTSEAAREDAQCRQHLIRTATVAAFIVMASFIIVLSQFGQNSLHGDYGYWEFTSQLTAVIAGAVLGCACASVLFGRWWAGWIGIIACGWFALSLAQGRNPIVASVKVALTGKPYRTNNSIDCSIALVILFGLLTALAVVAPLIRGTLLVRAARRESRTLRLKSALQFTGADPWKAFRTFCVSLISLILLIPVGFVEENWRGHRAWQKHKREMEAKGEHLDWAYFIPPPVPDTENFFKAPSMETWFAKRGKIFSIPIRLPPIQWYPSKETDPVVHGANGGDYPPAVVIDWLKRYEAEFKLLAAACERPKSRLDGDYKFLWSSQVPNFVAFRTMAQILSTRSEAYALTGNAELALQDIKMQIRLMDCTGSDITLVSAMIKVAIGGLTVTVIEGGLAKQVWDDSQLQTLQQSLKQLDFLADVFRSLQSERAANCGIADASYRKTFLSSLESKADTLGELLFLRVAPSGWFSQNGRVISEMAQLGLGAFDPANHRIFPEKLTSAEMNIERKLRRQSPYNFFARMALPNFTKAILSGAAYQTQIDQAIIVCALERYRLKNGRYPAALAPLTPQFIDKLPHDIFTGQPLKYRLLSNGKFHLYSVGKDQRDDGGDEKKDLVWGNEN